MGDPKKARKQYSRPRSPWRADQLAQELYLLGTFGLRNKRELWKAQTQLSSVRKQARTLLAATQAVRLREEKKLLDSLIRKGLIHDPATLDDILSLTVEDVLERRLQTIVWRKGLAKTPHQARQFIENLRRGRRQSRPLSPFRPYQRMGHRGGRRHPARRRGTAD